MGLDIVAFKNARPCESEDAYHVYSANGFDRLDGCEQGRYVGDDKIDFRAGSYSGYNAWRRELSKRFLGVDPEEVWKDPKRFAGQPFVELINFGDNEGCFGPKTSAKLAADFRVNEKLPSLDASLSVDETWFWDRYQLWRKAFELGEQDGFVILI